MFFGEKKKCGEKSVGEKNFVIFVLLRKSLLGIFLCELCFLVTTVTTVITVTSVNTVTPVTTIT